MARLITSGFELDSVTTGVEFDSSSGSPSIVTSPVHTGTYACQISTSGSTSYVDFTVYSANSARKCYARAWVNFTTLPSATCNLIGVSRCGARSL